MTTTDPAFILTDLDKTFSYDVDDPGPDEIARLVRVVELTCRHRNFPLRTAALLAVQRPDASAMQTLDDWERLDMEPIPGTSPLVAVNPEGQPIFAYDFSDVRLICEQDEETFVLDDFGVDVELPYGEEDHQQVFDHLSSSAHLDGIQIAPQYVSQPVSLFIPLRVDSTHYEVDIRSEGAMRSYARFFALPDLVHAPPTVRLRSLLSGWAGILLGHFGPFESESYWTPTQSRLARLTPWAKHAEVETVLAFFTSRSGLELVSAQGIEATLTALYENYGWPTGYRLDRCAWAAQRLIDHTQTYIDSRTPYSDQHYLPGLFEEELDLEVDYAPQIPPA